MLSTISESYLNNGEVTQSCPRPSRLFIMPKPLSNQTVATITRPVTAKTAKRTYVSWRFSQFTQASYFPFAMSSTFDANLNSVAKIASPANTMIQPGPGYGTSISPISTTNPPAMPTRTLLLCLRSFSTPLVYYRPISFKNAASSITLVPYAWAFASLLAPTLPPTTK